MYELSHPLLLILSLLPFVLRKFFPVAKLNYQAALKVPFFQDLRDQPDCLATPLDCFWFWHWFGIWILLVLALAGPRWIGPIQSAPEATRNIMLVLDISGSMGLEDMPTRGGYTSRWEVVRQNAWNFVEKRSQDKIGLILFGERAYLFAPLTHDQPTLKQRIDDASVGLAGQATALGDAMGLAIKHLQASPREGRIMILLTDGVANAGVVTPQKAADYAAEQGVKIYAIGLGPTHPQNQLFLQFQHANDLDEKTLMQIAAKTHGRYYRASDAQSLAAIYQDIEALEPVMQMREHLRPQHLYFYYPLALAFCWIFLLFVRQIYRDIRRGQ